MRPIREIPQELLDAAERGLDRLRTTITIDDTQLTLYNAGMMGSKIRFGLFARDLLIAALMLREEGFAREAIRFALLTMGKRYDPLTGEEPGRVIHEFNEVEIRGLLTRYNAAETSQLLLVASADYLRISRDRPLAERYGHDLKAALDYILSHIRGGLFWEDPQICGAKRYALRATYWKDSHLPGRADPAYPIAYTLVQAQTIAALRAAAELAGTVELGLSPAELEGQATKTLRALLDELWDRDLDYPLIAKDQIGPISGISSDGLHLLAYLRPEDLPRAKLEAICAGSKSLETPYGFRTYAPAELARRTPKGWTARSDPAYAPTAYHLGAIWPFEQFF
ncbi:MAG: MGH1-like glycoside hydrolase domain-containing protein, partial [Candidatus Bipolaricaulia bacterium]